MYKYVKKDFVSMQQSYADFKQSIETASKELEAVANSINPFWQGDSADLYLDFMVNKVVNKDYQFFYNKIDGAEDVFSAANKEITVLDGKCRTMDAIVGAATTSDEVKYVTGKWGGFENAVDAVNTSNDSLYNMLIGVANSVSGLVTTSDVSSDFATAHTKVRKINDYRNDLSAYGYRVVRFDSYLKSEFTRLQTNFVTKGVGSADTAYQRWLQNVEQLEASGVDQEGYNSAILNTFMYLDFFDKTDKLFGPDYKYTDIDETVRAKLENGTLTIGELVDELARLDHFKDNDYIRILKDAIAMDPSLGDYQIVCCSRLMEDEHGKKLYNTGTNGILFKDPVTNAYYVSYRGTSDGEWNEDGERLLVKDTDHLTVQMQQTVDFFNKCVENYGITAEDSLYVTGHSQGGGDAQITVLLSKYGELVDKCYSMDGEANSPDLIDYLINVEHKNDPGWFDRMTDKMYAINSHDDPVHCLGMVIISDEHTVSIVNGMDKSNFIVGNVHDIKGMFCVIDGKYTSYSGILNVADNSPSASVESAELIWENLCKLPEEERAACIRALMKIIEVANGGKMSGLNGENIQKGDLEIFVKVGLPLILDSVNEVTGCVDEFNESMEHVKADVKSLIKGSLDVVQSFGAGGKEASLAIAILKVAVDHDGLSYSDLGDILRGMGDSFLGMCEVENIVNGEFPLSSDTIRKIFDWEVTSFTPAAGWAGRLKDAGKAGWTKFADDINPIQKIVAQDGTKVVDKVGTGMKFAGWALQLVANGFYNYQEYEEKKGTDEEISKGRAVTETVTETLIDIGKDAAIAAGFAAGAALLGIAAPAAVVAGVAIGVGVVADMVCEHFTGERISEVVSDFVLDKGSEAIDAIAGWFKKKKKKKK